MKINYNSSFFMATKKNYRNRSHLFNVFMDMETHTHTHTLGGIKNDEEVCRIKWLYSSYKA